MVGVVSLECCAKFRITKFSSEGLGGNSMKVCTSENFLLYDICHMHRAIIIGSFLGINLDLAVRGEVHVGGTCSFITFCLVNFDDSILHLPIEEGSHREEAKRWTLGT